MTDVTILQTIAYRAPLGLLLDWLLVERERFRQLRLHGLEAIARRLTEAGCFGLAIEAALAAVACEPLRESAQREVIRAHLGEGNVSEAIRQYRSYAQLLADDLGATPSPAMDRLMQPVFDRFPAVAAVTAS